jgi:hypothetical protein
MRFFRFLRTVSLAHSVIYLALLYVWLAPGHAEATTVLGWTHGCTWIGMSLLTILAAQLRVVPWMLVPLVSVVGVFLGPFAGSWGFVRAERRLRRAGSLPVPAGA